MTQSASVRLLTEAAAAEIYGPAMRPHSGTGRFDPLTGIYVPDSITTPPLMKWHKALAKARAGTRTAKLLVSGDSVVFGQYATPASYSGSAVYRLRSLIDTAMGGGAGSGVIWFWTTFAGVAWRDDDTRVVYDSAAEQTGYGPFALSCLSFHDSASFTFSPDTECDGFNIYYIKQTDANVGTAKLMTVQIDSGPGTTYSTGGAATENSVGVLSVSAGTLDTHTLTVTGNDASAKIYVIGVESTVSGGAGVQTTGCGAPGKQLSTYNAASADGAASWQYLTDGIAPDLTVIQFGHNEYLNQIAIATQLSDLTTAVERAQAGGSDVLLLTTVPNSSTSLTPSQADVDGARYTIADQLNVPVLDLGWWWQSYASDTGLYANGTHPDNSGYQSMAELLYAAVMPDR